MKPVSAWTRACFVLAGFGIALGQQSNPAAAPIQPGGGFRPLPQTKAETNATKPVGIVDPVLLLEAYSLKVPADWIFEGTVLQGPSCAPVPNAIYRAMSPDGITEMKALPGLSWSWANPISAAPRKAGDCLGWDKEVSASDFVKYMAGTLKVEFVRDEPVPPATLAQFQDNVKKNNQSFAARTPPGQPLFQVKGDMAAAVVRYNINSIPVEELLSATISCSDAPRPLIPSGWGHVYTCTGSLTRSRARQGNLEASKPAFGSISKSIALNQQWAQKWTAVIQAAGAAIRQTGREQEAALLRQHAQAMQAQALQTRQQQDMMDATRRGTDMALKRDREATAAQSRVADDWVDYALDQQKRMDPATGKVTKDSSQYSYTWINEFSERYQTNDINDNPNGRLKGNWTLQQNIP